MCVLAKHFFDECRQAHKLLKLYCEKSTQLFGEAYCAPNMHMRLHLHGSIRDFGPVYAFWLYSFGYIERSNGILRTFKTNNHNVNIQHMRKFFQRNALIPSYENKITAQKMTFFIKNFFSKCDQIRRKLRIWSHLLKKFLMENFIFCAVDIICSFLE